MVICVELTPDIENDPIAFSIFVGTVLENYCYTHYVVQARL
jgi:hypothetical protein